MTSDPCHYLLIVTGSTLRAEEKDRPLAYRLAEEVGKRLGPEANWRVRVVSDLFYLNCPEARNCPTISIGGGGVNHVANVLANKLPTLLSVDHVLTILMDVTLDDLRCSIWGTDHEATVEAVDTFIDKGHLDRFLCPLKRTYYA